MRHASSIRAEAAGHQASSSIASYMAARARSNVSWSLMAIASVA